MASAEDFARYMSPDPSRPLSSEEMLRKMRDAVRADGDYQKHYKTTDAGDKVFDASGAGKGQRGGDAFENVKVIEEALARIDLLRQQPSTRELEQKVRQIADEAVDKALNASQETPFDGGYSVRDTVIKTHIDPQKPGEVNAYRNTMKMTLEALARDGVTYSEQSQSVKKLAKGAFPKEMVAEVLREVNAERKSQGLPPLDVRFLAMVETRFFGEGPGSGSAEDWNKQLDAARAVVRERGDVMGIDIAGPEVTNMQGGGQQRTDRVQDMLRLLKEEGARAGRRLVFRPHVGEGYVEMPNDPTTGRPQAFDRDNNRAHYDKAERNMSALLDSIEAATQPGPRGEPALYDPNSPDPEIRFGHATHATPEIAERMKKLGITAEVNLGSNAVSGSLQDDAHRPAGRDVSGRLKSFDDHSLLVLAAEGVSTILSTDAQSVMSTTLSNEYAMAEQVLRGFRGVPEKGIKGQGAIPVTKAVFEAALVEHPHLTRPANDGPFELRYSELPRSKQRNVDATVERLHRDAQARRQDVHGSDAADRRRDGGG